MRRAGAVAIVVLLVLAGRWAHIPVASAQGPSGVSKAMGAGPWMLNSNDYRLRVTRVAELVSPWGMAFPSKDEILVTERVGRLRIVRNGVLDPRPITGVPDVAVSRFSGLLDIALHPRFAENHLVYLTYSKAVANNAFATALFRARLDGNALVDGRDIFVANTPSAATIARVTFGSDGMVYMSVPVGNDEGMQAQNPVSHRGKILRLRDDGTVPPDNPLIGKHLYGTRYQPEIYTLGHRVTLGLTLHPETGELWEHENGPQGGDEINILHPGANYGWPFVSLGINYDGTPFSPSMPGAEMPVFHWAPSIAPSGLTFYTGNLFPKWKRSAFVGGMRGERIDRLTFNDRWQVVGVEPLMRELGQRFRDLSEGPDGRLYAVTDSATGVLLAIEPITTPASGNTTQR